MIQAKASVMLAVMMISLTAERASGALRAEDSSAQLDRRCRLEGNLQQEGRRVEVIEGLRSCLRLDPTYATVYARLREVYGRGRTVDQVVAELRGRVEQDDGDFISLNLLGVLYAKLGRWSDAVAALEKAVRLEPRDVDAWTNLGWLSSELKQLDRAKQVFGRALALDPAYSRAHAGMGGLHAEGEADFDKAIEGYQRALSSEPNNPTYLYDMGWAYYRKGMANRALEVLMRAFVLNPDDPAGRAKLGWTRLRLNEYRAAIEEFQEALRLEPGYTFARFGLARALQAEGHRDAAIVEYKRAWRESKNDVYLIYLFSLYLQRSFWFVLLVVCLGMVLTLFWLLRRKAVPRGAAPAPES